MRKCPSVFPLACAGFGIALLLFSLIPIASLDRGGGAAVFPLLLLMAVLAMVLLARTGTSRPRLLVCLLPVGLAFFLRACLLNYVSSDYQIFLSQWVETFRAGGGFAALKEPIGNYNVPYLYILAAISYLPLPDLYLIKLFSILFDVILAWGGLRLAALFCPEGSLRPLVCFCLLLLLPTVVLNGSCWGQCDTLYGALALHALACALGRRPGLSVFLMGIAFSFKLQTVFLLPLWGGLWLVGRVKFRHLFLFPAAYALTCIPALLLGKPLVDILSVYLGQTQEGAGSLNYNSASLFSFLPYGIQVDEALWSRLAILAALALVLALLILLYLNRERASAPVLLTASVVLAIGVPFLLPYMHDRYFFLADVLTLAWACAVPARFPASILVQLASLSSYLIYLRQKFTLIIPLGDRIYPMLAEGLLMLAALLYALFFLLRQLRPSSGKPG